MEHEKIIIYARKLARKLFGVITIKPKNGARNKWALLSYVTHPFAIQKKELMKSPHTNPWECLEIADILLERGYGVDVIDWTNTTFIPKKDYAMVIDVNQNLERLTPLLPKNCVKIFYITGAHWSYQNSAERARLKELKKRRGIALVPRRQMTPSSNIEYADYATSLGNNFAKDTYAYAGKPIVQIPLLSTVAFPSPEKKNFNKISKNFVWIGGGGAIHKGLDLALECFAKLPEYRLAVCGPVAAEKDFAEYYKRELYETPNIKLVGRIDIRGNQFKKIISDSVGLIYPTCSEGQTGSVITGLHAGLIPIVTYQSGVDVEPFGIMLKTASMPEIEKAIKTIASLPEKELRKRAVSAWNYARENHTMEIFRKTYAAFIDNVIKEKNL
ncbi:glycosyltransferase [Patescibacteria group bacterium]|nr:glycosyltransferase [Patescibacteria group bacterium]MBU4353407.1 glycosyltransferase [Patescibacteria group bacterium]MBU4477223.1 glycosyltransferase [Patescibacteria group bacterium]MCG2699174.1 glycosyltransferase [Candidatus Parcubacteria bacterium]